MVTALPARRCAACRTDLAADPEERLCRCGVCGRPIRVRRDAHSLCLAHDHIAVGSVDSVRVAVGKPRLFRSPTIRDLVKRAS